MAYNPYVGTGYNPYQPSNQFTAIPSPQTMANTSLIWVQGEAGAKSWAVAPGKSVMLMDSESSTFYIKSSDNSGMPMPLRIFDYKERTEQVVQSPAIQHQEIDTSKFVTWDDLDKRLNELLKQKEVRTND